MKKFFFCLSLMLVTLFSANAETKEPNAKNCFIIPDFEITAGKAFDFKINMNNELNVTTTQAVITLPDGFSFTDDNEDEDYYGYNEDRSKTSKKKYQTFAANLAEGTTNKMTVLSYSTDNTPFQGNEGEILTIHCVAPATLPSSFVIKMGYEIGCEGDIQYGDPNVIYDFSFNVVEGKAVAASSTGISEVKAESNVELYSVDGQTQKSLKKGLNIVKTANGVKKVMVK